MRQSTKALLFWLGILAILIINVWIGFQGFSGKFMGSIGTFVYVAVSITASIMMIISKVAR